MDYNKRIKTQRETIQKGQQINLEKYGENLKKQLQSLSKYITSKKAKKQECQSLLNTTKKTQEQRPPSKSHISTHFEDIKKGSNKESQKQIKRNWVYDTESFKQEPESEISAQNNEEIIQKMYQGKSPYSETMSTAYSNNSHKQPNQNKIGINDFQVGKKLGSGKFGEVFIARHRNSGFICAIKKVSKENMSAKLMVQLIREMKIQSFLNHPNIVKLYSFFADQKNIYLVQQLCYSGQLYSLLRSKKRLSEQLTKTIVQQICRALDYMHECQIIHRDLKPQNIIYNYGLIKICDFGWSISSKTMRQTFCGTPIYVSPELLKRKNYNNKIDVWSVGILTYQLLFGRVPFDIVNEKDFSKIVEQQIKFTKAIVVSQQSKDFIEICLKKDPRDRYTVPELLQHPFIVSFQNPTLVDLA